MKENIGLILFDTVNYCLNKVIAKTLIKVSYCHEKRLVNLRHHKRKLYGESNTLFIRSIVQNYSSYNLSVEEEKPLSFGLDQHIPTTLNRNNLRTEFEYFYQNITNDISYLCEKYSDIKLPYKYQRIIDTLRRNNSIVVLKQDKGRGVVILDKNIYVEKCLSILDTNQFMKIDKNPTSSNESKIQRILRKIKSKLSA